MDQKISAVLVLNNRCNPVASAKSVLGIDTNDTKNITWNRTHYSENMTNTH